MRRTSTALVAIVVLAVAAPSVVAADDAVTVSVDVPRTVQADEEVAATVTITNDKEHAVVEEVTVRVAGAVVDEFRVIVPAGGRKNVTVAFTAPADAGEYRLAVEGRRDLTGATLSVVDGPIPRVAIDAPDEVPAGGTATLALTATTTAATDRLALEADVTNASAIAIDEVTLSGSGSVGFQVVDGGSVLVTATGLDADATLRATVRVDVPADPPGDVGVAATATADGLEDRATVAIPVVEPANGSANESERSRFRSVTRSVAPGGTATVATTVTVDGPRLSVTERVEGAANVSVEEVRIDGPGTVLFSSAADGTVNVAVAGLGTNTTVTVEYVVGVPPDATAGDRIRISGRSTTLDGETDLGVSTVRVSASPLAPYAGDDGRIDAAGLQRAIADWASGEIDTELLQRAIQAWASEETVVENG